MSDITSRITPATAELVNIGSDPPSYELGFSMSSCI